MALPLYLAMTAAEMQANSALPEHPGYMACHFSPYGTGLSNCPSNLPEGTMLILNDRIPCCKHDHQLVANQLVEIIERFGCSCVLLDFQRPGYEETSVLATKLTAALPCPVGISDIYAKELECPVFLPPLPLDIPSEEYLAPWQGREIWLDSAMDATCITLTETGSTSIPLPYPQLERGFPEETLHCHYSIHTETDSARFTLWRTWEDLQALLAKAGSHGVTRAVGLWQELNQQESFFS